MQIISATELARNTRGVLDKVVTFRESMAIERNHITIAQIVPSERIMTAAQALDGMRFPLLSRKQGTAWLQDSKTENFDDVVCDPWV